MHTASFETELKWAKRAGFLATLLTAVITARFGWMNGEDLPTKLAYSAGLSICSFMVGFALVFAWKCYQQHLPKPLIAACVAVFVVAVAVEMLSHIGSAASARNHDIETASAKTNVYTDQRMNLEEARAELAGLPKARPVATVNAELDRMKGRKGWNESNACADVSAYPTLCRAVGSLRAELGSAQQRDSLNARIEKLSSANASSDVGHSVVDSQTSYLASLISGTIKPSSEQKYWTNSGVTLLLGLYFVIMGLVNMIVYALESHMKPKAPEAAIPAPVVAPNVVPFQAPPVAVQSAGQYPAAEWGSLKISGQTSPARIAQTA